MLVASWSQGPRGLPRSFGGTGNLVEAELRNGCQGGHGAGAWEDRRAGGPRCGRANGVQACKAHEPAGCAAGELGAEGSGPVREVLAWAQRREGPGASSLGSLLGSLQTVGAGSSGILTTRLADVCLPAGWSGAPRAASARPLLLRSRAGSPSPDLTRPSSTGSCLLLTCSLCGLGRHFLLVYFYLLLFFIFYYF